MIEKFKKLWVNLLVVRSRLLTYVGIVQFAMIGIMFFAKLNDWIGWFWGLVIFGIIGAVLLVLVFIEFKLNIIGLEQEFYFKRNAEFQSLKKEKQ